MKYFVSVIVLVILTLIALIAYKISDGKFYIAYFSGVVSWIIYSSIWDLKKWKRELK